MSVTANQTGRSASARELTLLQRVERLERELAILRAALLLVIRKAGGGGDTPPALGVRAADGIAAQDNPGGG